MDDLAEDLDEEERATMLKKLDTSGDGRIEWKGMIACLQPPSLTTLASLLAQSLLLVGVSPPTEFWEWYEVLCVLRACSCGMYTVQGESGVPLPWLTTELCAGAALRCVATGTWRKTMGLTALAALRMKKTHHRNTTA